MTTLAATMLALMTTPALANSHEEPADCSAMEGDEKAKCEEAKAMAMAKKELEELGDCSDKEGDDKTACEAKKAELEKKVGSEEPSAGKGGKASRGNTNRMEEEAADE